MIPQPNQRRSAHAALTMGYLDGASRKVKIAFRKTARGFDVSESEARMVTDLLASVASSKASHPSAGMTRT